MNRCIVCHDITADSVRLHSSEESCYEACYPLSIIQPIVIYTCSRHKKELEESDIADYMVLCYEWNKDNFHRRESVIDRIKDYKNMIKGVVPPIVYGWADKTRTRRKR